MAIQNFKFVGNINGQRKELIVKAQVENGNVITNKYCPNELLTGGLNWITPIHGEVFDEFVYDCRKQVLAMEGVGVQKSLLDVHIAGLTAVVMDHLARCGRIIFGDLLIYMDCFSLLLEANGFSSSKIIELYPRVALHIVGLYPDYVYNTVDLSPFKNSHMYMVLSNSADK